MKQQEVFKKIGTILKELNDQYNYLEANENELNDLELELFVANAHFLADHSEVLKKLNSVSPKPSSLKTTSFFEPIVQRPPIPAVEPEPIKEVPTPLPPVAAKTIIPEENPVPHIDLRGDDTGADYSYIRQEPEIIRHELSMDDIPGWELEDDEPELKPAESSTDEPAPVNEPRALIEPAHGENKIEKVAEEPLTINQKISAQLNNTGGQHFQAASVADLKQAITLNDKLLYIKDLFNGYNLAYSEAIDILNRFSTFDEADKFLKNNYAAKNNWESKQATVVKFYALLQRRYA